MRSQSQPGEVVVAVRDLDREDTLRGLRGALVATKAMVESPQFKKFEDRVKDRRDGIESKLLRGEGTDAELREMVGQLRAFRVIEVFMRSEVSGIEKQIKQVEGFGRHG